MVPLSQKHSASSGCRWKKQPPAVEGSFEYIQRTVTDKQQRVALQLGLGMGLTTPHYKNKLVTKSSEESQTWMNDKIGTQDLERGNKEFV
jgi:hypothetical protein